MNAKKSETAEEIRYTIRTAERSAPCAACGEPDTGRGAVGFRGDEPVCGVCLLHGSPALGLLVALAAVARAYAATESAPPETSRAALEELGAFARVYDRIAAGWGPPGVLPLPRSMKKQLARRLSRTEKNPRLALTEGWYRDPEFLAALCDRCEHIGEADRAGVLELAKYAVQAAERLGDQHLIHRSHAVLSFACVGVWDLFWAGKALEVVRESALGCCPRCRSDLLLREADLKGEERRAEDTLRAVEGSIVEGGDALSPEDLGARYLMRSVGYHWLGDRRRAVADAGRVVRETPFSAPPDQLLNGISFLTVWIAGGGPDDDAAAASHLETLAERVKGRRDWAYGRSRLYWARGQVAARRGDLTGARHHVERAFTRLLKHGLPREAVAAAVDVGQLLCRHDEPWGDNADKARRVIHRCLSRRQDLSEAHREGLEEMVKVLEVAPQRAFDELVAFRRSFVAPVPGVMAERLRGG